MSEDYDLWLRMLGKTSFAIVPQVLYTRRIQQSGTSARNISLQQFTAQLARQCYQQRCQGLDDNLLASNEFLAYTAAHPEFERFAQHALLKEQSA